MNETTRNKNGCMVSFNVLGLAAVGGWIIVSWLRAGLLARTHPRAAAAVSEACE